MTGGIAIRDSWRDRFVNAGSADKVIIVDESGGFINDSNALPITTPSGNPLNVVAASGGLFSSSNQFTFSTTATQIAAYNSNRKGVAINVDGTDVYIGSGNNVLVSNGYLIGDNEKITIPVTSAIWGITSGGNVTVFTLEVL